MAYTTLSRFRCQIVSWSLVYGRWQAGNSMVSKVAWQRVVWCCVVLVS